MESCIENVESVYLPPEILYKIFSNIEHLRCKCAVLQVCSLWYCVGSLPNLWTKFDFRTLNIMGDMCSWFKRVEYHQFVTVFGQERFKKLAKMRVGGIDNYHILHVIFNYENCETCKQLVQENVPLNIHSNLNISPNLSHTITKLTLFHSTIEMETLDYLSTLQKLTNLTIMQSKFLTTTIEPISKLKHLKTLVLEDLKIKTPTGSIEDLYLFKKLPTLTKLSLKDTFVDNWEGFLELSNLTDLNVSGCLLSANYLSYITRFSKLEKLDFSAAISYEEDGLDEEIRPLNNLRYLDFGCNNVTQENLLEYVLPLVSSLHHLDLTGIESVTFDSLHQILEKGKNLECVNLMNCLYISDEEVDILNSKFPKVLLEI
eukprot:TRINITY_DN514_c0_g1_i1.p1 TRINITY_DN514_c0_g1~~TRINITY_DN514_c0_g1_i1.p1  ORF type:complete len:373 (-),score=47.46 TRINITY_DN514_c0_g1_i1:98-1216(-)